MANPSKNKGTAFETAVVRYLCEQGLPCERRALRGVRDGGDIAGLPLTIECKNTKQIDLAGALLEAQTAAAHNGDPLYAAVFKRPRRHDVADAYVVLPLHLFATMLRER